MSNGSKVEYDLTALKSKADLLGIKYPNNISGAKLKDKIDLHMVDIEGDADKSSVGVKSVGPRQSIHDIEREARKPITVIILDNDSSDLDNPTVIAGVENAYFKVGPVIIKKDVEQDVPACIVESLKHKTMIKWVPSINQMTKKPTGNKIAEHRPRYTIQYV